MRNLLIGSNGFLGNMLFQAFPFDELVNSGETPQTVNYNLVVCAAPSASKWRASTNPERDCDAVQNLIGKLKGITANRFVLLSTVDVYTHPVGIEESAETGGSSVYGDHRLRLDRVVRNLFPGHLILRLGGLVGPGLRKNPIYDYAHGLNLNLNSPHSRMQFLPTDTIPTAIHAFQNRVGVTINLTAEPIILSEIQQFGRQTFTGTTIQEYDVWSKVVLSEYGKPYWASRHESLAAIDNYITETSHG